VTRSLLAVSNQNTQPN